MINEYFDKIYLLNLFKNKNRLNSSKEKLNSHSIEYEVFHGCDGSVMNLIWQKFSNPNFSNPNYLGCSISHLSIYKDAILNGYDRILILEDDFQINKNINNIFNSLEIPTWEDVFYLGYIPLTDDCSMWNYNLFGIGSHNAINHNIFNPKNLWGLYSYGITNTLMSEIIDDYNKEFPMEIDRYLVKNIQIRNRSIAISPQLFCCDPSIHSDNLGMTPPNMKLKSIDSRFASLEDYL